MFAKQISSLEKIRTLDTLDYPEFSSVTLLKGEQFSYQIAFLHETLGKSNNFAVGKIEIDSPLAPYIKIYNVENAVMDCPANRSDADNDSGYITREPGLMPDVLVPAKEKDFILIAAEGASAIRIEINLPPQIEAGTYEVNVNLRKKHLFNSTADDEYIFKKTLLVEVLNESILPQKLIYTRWFYADCISDYHRVDIYSEEHWSLIEKYISAAVEVGVSMILVPIHTPPLDTAIGLTRPCVQLVDIEKSGDTYTFGFEKLRRFISVCKKCGVKYYEMAHLFSQWGAKCAPNIAVTENGEKKYAFGWHTAADSDEYVGFLKQYISAVSKVLRDEGIDEFTYFHVSDEPSLDKIDAYARAASIIKPLIGNSKTFDALSNYEFYQNGLVECPVTSVAHIKNFLGKGVKNQWVYYCCSPQSVFPNSFMAFPLSRVRIMGMLMYKYDIKGFLHWGLNFYNSMVSHTNINPYLTTSSGGCYPSGDPFILYPSRDGVYHSLRGKAFYEAIVDMDVCRTLERYIGRDKVVEIIDSAAGGELLFDSYPTDSTFLPSLREKLAQTIKEHI